MMRKSKEDSPEFELLHPDQGDSLVIQRVLSVAPFKFIDDDSWRRNNIFRTKCNFKDKVCNMINDGGSCENVVSTYMVENLALKTVDHPEPYQLTWLKKGNAIKGSKRCFVQFSIGRRYKDKADDQEIENVKDEERKNVKDQQVFEQTINETADTISSLQSEVASLDAKGSLDANEDIQKDHTWIHELEKQVEKLSMELQLKNNFREALETTSKDLEKKMLDLNPTLHDPQKVVVDQKKKHYKTKYALKIDDKEFKKAKSEATTKIKKLAKEEYEIPNSKEFSRHHLEDKVVVNEGCGCGMVSMDDDEWFDHYLGQREFLVSRPTTLGDAFSLALITEARLDGQAAPVAGTTTKTFSNNDGDESESLRPVTPMENKEAIKSRDTSILSSLFGHGSPRSLQLLGTLGTGILYNLRPPYQPSPKKYLLEFTSEYGISEDLHPELPGPEERIVDFSEGKRVFPTIADWRLSAPKDEMPAEDTYSPEAVAVLNTHRTPIQKQPKALLCLVGLSRRYFLRDDVYLTFLHDDNRDMNLFNLIHAPNPSKVKIGTRPRVAHEVPLLTVTTSGVIEMKDLAAATESFGTTSTIERSPLDFANENPSQQSTGGDGTKDQETGLVGEIAAMGSGVIKKHRKRGNDGVDANAPPKETPIDVSDSDPLSFAKLQSVPKQDVVQSFNEDAVAGDPESENTSFTSMVGSPKSIYQPDQYNINLAWKVAMGSQLRLRFGHEAKLLKKSVAQVARRDQRIQARENEIKNLEALLEAETHMKKAAEAKNAKIAQVIGEEKLKAAFEEFKKYEDDRVEKRCAKMDARLDALSVDFDEELIAKGMSEGLKYEVEHRKANLVLEAIEAYDSEADTKYVEALYTLRDLKYPVVDQLESLKDALIDVIMASLHLESDSGEDTSNPWSFKEEILLKDAIAANISRAEKKKKCRVVCRTHGVGSAHHVRPDGVPVSVHIIAPQGLAILLANAATQTKTSKNEASLKLLRSKSLPALYNLDWP
nr:reverse transcriptase domain-containing protein [Tanacetum cinerariifolium]